MEKNFLENREIAKVGLGNTLIFDNELSIATLKIEDLDLLILYNIDKCYVNFMVGDIKGRRNFMENLSIFFEEDYHTSLTPIKEVYLNQV